MAGLYLHIPFCKCRCIYCDFYSTTQGAETRRHYIAALCNEMAIRKQELKGTVLGSIYLGGGTPSQLSIDELQTLFRQIESLFPIANDVEITLEANPDDLTETYIQQLRRLPINRISLGVQTFDPQQLAFLRRRHTAQQAISAVKLCQQAGFGNISIDLIYGLPGQTLEAWSNDLQQALQLHTPHLSAYALIYEEGTALWKLKEQHKVYEADDELSLSMFEHLMDTTRQAGFEHYEISNFCQPGYRAVHNASYWSGVPYMGCGPGAHSFDGTNRQWNQKDLTAYLQVNGDTTKGLADYEELDTQTRYNDFIITSLRTSDGLDLERLEQCFGDRYLQYALKMARPHIKRKALELIAPTPAYVRGKLRLTRSGLFLSDLIMSDLLAVDE